MAEKATAASAAEDGFEWMVVEIFGHRQHWGRGAEVERFGAKMLRIDVPKVEFREMEDGSQERFVADWVTHYYGGAAIFSQTLTDEASVLKGNAPYPPARRLSLPAYEYEDEPDDDRRTMRMEFSGGSNG